MKNWIEKLQVEWVEFQYKYSDERLELANERLAAHRLAMAEGRKSPYTHPERYDFEWNPL